MKLIPILTEKSLSEAKSGKYTFWVDPSFVKDKIKMVINEAFGVHVTEVKTLNFKREVKRGAMGRRKIIPARKKAVVELKKDEKIDLFEVKEKK